jgi:hypothetical protein
MVTIPISRGYPEAVLEDDEGYTDEPEDGEDGADSEVVAHAEPAPIEKFHRSSLGMVMAAGMLGLRDVFEPAKDEEPAIVEDWAGKPVEDDPILMRLDPDHPEDSIVVVRPWLNRPHAGETKG